MILSKKEVVLVEFYGCQKRLRKAVYALICCKACDNKDRQGKAEMHALCASLCVSLSFLIDLCIDPRCRMLCSRCGYTTIKSVWMLHVNFLHI